MGTDFAGTLTFVVTGHLTKLTHLATDYWFEGGRQTLADADVAAARQSGAVVAGFGLGAVAACVLQAQHLLLRRGVFSVLGVAYGGLFAAYDGRRIPRWWKRRQVPEMMIVPPAVLEEHGLPPEAVSEAVRQEERVAAAAAAVAVTVVHNATLPFANPGSDDEA